MTDAVHHKPQEPPVQPARGGGAERGAQERDRGGSGKKRSPTRGRKPGDERKSAAQSCTP